MTPGNRRKRIGANSPAYFAEDEITLENPCYAEVIFCLKRKKHFAERNDELASKVHWSGMQKMICGANHE